ncbi:MAG: hypothetical protein RIB64_02335 [Arenibacter algicola]
MLAEKVYSIFTELSEAERIRCLKMCQDLVGETSKQKKPTRIGGMTDTELTERTIKTLKLKK